MKVLIGGAIAAVLGLFGLAIWWEEFFELLAGGIPIFLLLGGGTCHICRLRRDEGPVGIEG